VFTKVQGSKNRKWYRRGKELKEEARGGLCSPYITPEAATALAHKLLAIAGKGGGGQEMIGQYVLEKSQPKNINARSDVVAGWDK